MHHCALRLSRPALLHLSPAVLLLGQFEYSLGRFYFWGSFTSGAAMLSCWAGPKAYQPSFVPDQNVKKPILCQTRRLTTRFGLAQKWVVNLLVRYTTGLLTYRSGTNLGNLGC